MRKKNVFLDKIYQIGSFGISVTFGFFVGNGIQGIYKGRDYAVTQTVVSVSGLGFCLSRRAEPAYKQKQRALNKLFKKAVVSRDSIFYFRGWDFSNAGLIKKRRRYYFPQEEIGKYIFESMKLFFQAIVSMAVIYNRRKGLGVKEAVLHAVSEGIDNHVPSFKKNKTLDAFVEKDALMDLLALYMGHQILLKAQQAKSDEAVLEFLKKGFDSPTSPFYGVKDLTTTELFFDRKPYETGKKNIIDIISCGQVAALSAMGAAAWFYPFQPMPAFGAGIFLLGLSVLKDGVGDKHFKEQADRFLSPCFKLKTVTPLKMQEIIPDCYDWLEKQEFLTSFGQAELNLEVLKKIISVVKKISVPLVGRMARDILYSALIYQDTQMQKTYAGVKNGLTLEEASKKFGLKAVHKLMSSVLMIKEFEGLKDVTKGQILYHLEMKKAEYIDNLEKSKNNLDSQGFDKEWTPLYTLFKKMVETFVDDEKNKQFYATLSVIRGRSEHKSTVLPKVLRQLQKNQSQQTKS